MEMKKKSIRKYEERARMIDIVRELGKASFTISIIVKKKEMIKGFDVSSL